MYPSMFRARPDRPSARRVARAFTLATGIVAVWLGGVPARAEPQQDFPGWLAGVKADALAQGIGKTTLDQALANVQPIDRVLELDRRQPEFTMTFASYLNHVVTPARVREGRQRFRQNGTTLKAVEKQYGVPASQIVAMWGIESGYGRATGGFPVVSALATLAYDGRRSQYFRGELINALKIIDRGIPASHMQGSWAGAMGQCQFMPSTYLKYAKAWNAEDTPDIWTKTPDVFASSANYLAQIGWNSKVRWGRAVKLPKAGLASSLISLEVKKGLAEWNRLGVRLPDGKPLPNRPDIQASLVRAETGKNGDIGRGPPFLVYDNFRVLMKWNRSIFFAIAAGTLADRIETR